ncbi:MAG: hypothetical protein H6510_14495 [Acidobacteria bacterium]|nr:hypothetical protein [Acidobacteriota bacterium]MCB9399020.1 hypothetical protein [Acidobacteriota bacterium]
MIALFSLILGPPMTAQIPDRIILEEKVYYLQTNPLDHWLANHPEMRTFEASSTACWRGYYATWEIAGAEMILKQIHKCHEPEDENFNPEDYSKSTIKRLFPGQKKVVADWFSGTLIIPYGEMVNYVHMGYASTYEHYFLLAIKQGIVVKKLQFDHDKFLNYRREQFKKFQNTEAYRAMMKEAQEKNQDLDQTNEFIFVYATETYLSMEFEE